jgi:hypothetical protein
MPAFPKLAELSLDPAICQPTDFEWVALCKQLTMFMAPGTAFTDDHLEVLAKCPNLKTVRCSLAKLTDDGLAPLASLRELEELNIHSNSGVTGAGLKYLVSLPKLTTLQIGGAVFEAHHLSQVAPLKRVTKLHFHGSTVFNELDECVKQFALLQGQIKDLEIMYAKDVTEDQVEAIKKAMPRTVITVRK